MVDPADYSGADYKRAICTLCDDFRSVAGPEGTDGSVPCPRCGTDEQRRELFAKRALVPEVRVSDLNEEEADLFRQWRFRGHHELDCLRWIEGRRYVPEEDAEFMADVKVRLDEWRAARDKQHEEFVRTKTEILHPCIKCGAACDEQTLFCPPCWQRQQEKKGKKA